MYIDYKVSALYFYTLFYISWPAILLADLNYEKILCIITSMFNEKYIVDVKKKRKEKKEIEKRRK